jgi:hypothetical protein
MNVPVCEGCGRAAGVREVYCAACGRDLPGRRVQPSDATPPGWLVAAGARGDGGLFEPLPSVPIVAVDPVAPPRAVAWPAAAPGEAEAEAEPEPELLTLPGGPGWGVRESPREQARQARRRADDVLPQLLEACTDVGATVLTGSAPSASRPQLRALYRLLLVLVVASSLGAVVLLVLHVLLDR